MRVLKKVTTNYGTIELLQSEETSALEYMVCSTCIYHRIMVTSDLEFAERYFEELTHYKWGC